MKPLLAACAFLFLSVPVRATSTGEDGAAFLSIPVGGRPGALGGAYTALAADAHAPVWNPSGLAFLDSPQASLMHLSYLDSTSFEFFSLAQPLSERQGLGVSVQWFRPGDVNATDEFGNKAGTFSGHYGAYNLAYGLRVAPAVSVGATVKFIDAAIAGEAAHATAADAGAMWKATDRVAVGASVTNMGQKLKFLEHADALPLTGRLGVAVSPLSNLTLSVEGSQERSNAAALHTGAEWRPIDLFAVRAGFRSDAAKSLSGIAGLTAGVGLRWKGQEFDYTWATFDELGSTNYFSLLLRWNQPRSAS